MCRLLSTVPYTSVTFDGWTHRSVHFIGAMVHGAAVPAGDAPPAPAPGPAPASHHPKPPKSAKDNRKAAGAALAAAAAVPNAAAALLLSWLEELALAEAAVLRLGAALIHASAAAGDAGVPALAAWAAPLVAQLERCDPAVFDAQLAAHVPASPGDMLAAGVWPRTVLLLCASPLRQPLPALAAAGAGPGPVPARVRSPWPWRTL